MQQFDLIFEGFLRVVVLLDSKGASSSSDIFTFSREILSKISALQPLQNSLWWSLLVLAIVYAVKHFALRTPSVSNSLFCAIVEFPNDVCIALIPIIIAWGAYGNQVYAGFYFVLFAIILNIIVLLGRHYSAKHYTKENWVLCTIIPIAMYVLIVFFVTIVYSLLS